MTLDNCHTLLDDTTQSTLQIHGSVGIQNSGDLMSSFQNGNILCRKTNDTWFDNGPQRSVVECPSTCASGYTKKHCSTNYGGVYVVCQKDPQ